MFLEVEFLCRGSLPAIKAGLSLAELCDTHILLDWGPQDRQSWDFTAKSCHSVVVLHLPLLMLLCVKPLQRLLHVFFLSWQFLIVFSFLWTSNGAVSGVCCWQHTLFLIPEFIWPRGESGCYRRWASWRAKSPEPKPLVALPDARDPWIPLLLRGNMMFPPFHVHSLWLPNRVKELPHGPSSVLTFSHGCCSCNQSGVADYAVIQPGSASFWMLNWKVCWWEGHVGTLRYLLFTFMAQPIHCNRNVWDSTGEEILRKLSVWGAGRWPLPHALPCNELSSRSARQEFSFSSTRISSDI